MTKIGRDSSCLDLATAHRRGRTSLPLRTSLIITDALKYIFALLLSLRAVLHLEPPHINVLGVKGMQYEGTLSSLIRGTSLFADFNLEYYTEVQIWQKEGELAKNVKLKRQNVMVTQLSTMS